MYIRNPLFTKGTQEDSHEVLRCMFDALKDEEIQVRILTSAIRNTCKLIPYIYLCIMHQTLSNVQFNF